MEFDPMVLACSAIQPCHLLHLRAVVQARDDGRYAHFPLKPWLDGLKCGNACAVAQPYYRPGAWMTLRPVNNSAAGVARRTQTGRHCSGMSLGIAAAGSDRLGDRQLQQSALLTGIEVIVRNLPKN
jgi:hypothetical protein